jgi:hypothetical protein
MAEYCDIADTFSASTLVSFIVFQAACAVLGLYSLSVIKSRSMAGPALPENKRGHRHKTSIVIDSSTQVDRRRYSRLNNTSPPKMEMAEKTQEQDTQP